MSTQAVTLGTTNTAATAPTNGPSSGAPVAGGGPVPATADQTLLGTHLLPAPVGQPKTIHLADGSRLVPLAMVDSSGRHMPLTDGGSLAPQGDVAAARGAGAAAAPAAPAASAAATAATPAREVRNAAVTGGGATGFEPKGFLYNDLYYAKFHDAAPIDLDDRNEVERRMAKSTMAYLLEEEPDVDDFGITDIRIRSVDKDKDRDLLAVNPRSHWFAEVVGVDGTTGTAKQKVLPLVMNSDGAVFVDPRVRGH